MIINGKEYKIPEIDYNASCDLEEYGFSIMSGMNRHKLATSIRAFLALCIGNMELAGKELEEHLTDPECSGSTLEEIAQEISEAMEKSPFFQKLLAKQKALEAKAKKKPQNTAPGEK